MTELTPDLTPEGLRARGSLKWTAHDPDVLAAWVAEMDYGLAPPVAEALHAAVDRGETGYPSFVAERATADAAAAFWERRFGWRVDPEQVFPAPDVIEGIRRAIVHLTRPGTPVVLHSPVYFPFFSMVERAGREVIQVESLTTRDGYRLDIDGIAAAFEEGAGSIVLCNPWNPTGRSLTEDEIATVLEVATNAGARVITDEVHAALTLPGATHTVADRLAPGEVVTVTSASKAWNLPGLKCAQVVLTNNIDAEVWSAYFTHDKVGVGTFGLLANAVAYQDGEEWLDSVLTRLEVNRKILGDLLDERLPRVGYFLPEATYLAWLDFTELGLEEPASALIEKARVALTEGSPFGLGGSGHARLNFATTTPILADIVERMAAAAA